MTARVLVVGGTSSGVGKTSVTLGLARALTRRGLRVRAAKVGPDFLDPMHLAKATGRRCYNLDTYLMGAAYVQQLAAEAAHSCDCLLVEGVMGLFDGVTPDNSSGSTAEIARLLDAPILLVADARGQARSLAATIHGFCSFEGTSIVGICANRVGSEGHAKLLSEALNSCGLPPLVAGIPEGALPTLASRHLGLVSPRSDDSFDALADAVEARLSIETVLSLMRPLRVSVRASEERVEPTSLRLAVAEDEAFQFVYADFRERLESMGVTWMPFSPLRDSALPEGAQALYLPGGYPEEYAEPLAANRPLWRAVRAFAVHRPIYAECGGMMVLGQSLVARNGQRYLMSRLLPFATRLGRRVARLGYVEVTLERDGFWGKKGDRCRGHEFHYSEFEEPPATECIYRLNYAKGGQRVEGVSQGRTLASYVHLHFASRSERLGELVREWSR